MSGTDRHAHRPAPRAGAHGGLKTFRCGDVVPGCDEVFRGTRPEIMSWAARHAQRAHGTDPRDPEMLAAVRAAIRPA